MGPAAVGVASSLESARLAVLPESPRGRTVAVQSVSSASDTAVATVVVPEVPADWPLPAPAVLRSTTGAMLLPPQAAVINAPATTTSNERLKRILWRMLLSVTPSFTGP